MGTKRLEDQYSDEEIARRRDELAKRMLNMPPRPLKPKPNVQRVKNEHHDKAPQRPTDTNT
jgi:hypothetical protein